MTHKTLRLTFPLVLLAAIACKKQDEPVATAGYQAGTPGAAGGAATGAPSATAAPTVTPAPSASSALPAPAAPDPAAVATLTPLLTKLAATQTVAGSKPIGTVMVGTVGGAQVLEQQITLQPKKCYSVVALGSAPITELNVQLLQITLVPSLTPILAVDQDVGLSATLGKKPNCFTWLLSPLPQPAKVVISATGGPGLAGAQIFEK